MTILYPRSYGTTVGTFDQMMAELRAHGHPEYIRRMTRWLLDQGGRMGIGDAWRATGTQPNLWGFAPEGRSFHQDQKFRSGFIGSCAVDLIVRVPGGAHRSPYWSEVPRQGSALAKKYGLHCNIDSEPWHMQPIEIDGWYSWIKAGSPDPVKGYPIPSPAPAPVPVVLATPPGYPSMSMAKGSTNANTVVTGWPGGRVSTLQAILGGITVDGRFGPQTDAKLREVQKVGGLIVDGIYGKQCETAFLAWRGK